jgi:UDP-GlcNAc:undecaprenyl-phosphate/decaprenyl-phosphate GlcNAc-1-phosphate transferase
VSPENLALFALLVYSIVATLVSFLGTHFGTRYLISYLVNKKMTVEDYHKQGKPPIPRPGGPAIIIGLTAGELVLFAISGSLAVLALVLVTVISGLVGIVDDLKTLSGVAKPALLLVAGLPLIILQFAYPNAHIYSHHMYLPLFSTPTNLPLIYPLIILVALPVVTNTINTIDVLNGVVSGFILIACVPVGFAIVLRILVGKEHPIILLALLPLVASVFAFYMFHKYPSKIFPGDSGAIALGGAYGAMAIIGGVEVVAVIAILPAILNSFFFLSSVRRLVEHRQIKDQPIDMLPDLKMVATKNRAAPVTLMRLLVASKAKSEEEISLDILKLAAFSALLAGITAVLTWGITIA